MKSMLLRSLVCIGMLLMLLPLQEVSAQQPQKVKTIFDYKAELGLSDDQVKQMRGLIDNLNNFAKQKRTKRDALGKEIESLIAKNGDMREISAKIKEAYALEADTRIADIETGRKMNAVLTQDQIKKWNQIRASTKK